MKIPDLLISVDAESRGLFGEVFAVGWVVFEKGREVSSGIASCPFEEAEPHNAPASREDDAWVRRNVIPVLPSPSARDPGEVRAAFWTQWTAVRKRGGVLLVECGHPVEGRLLLDCIRDDPGRRGDFPRPILDLCDFLWAAGLNPLEEYARRPDEWPRHHPVCDARATGRLFHQIVAGMGTEHVPPALDRRRR